MPNVVVTSSTNRIDVDFGDYSSSLGFDRGSWRKDAVVNFKLFGSFVTAHILGEANWTVSYAASTGSLIVDSVDGVAPTSDSDLYDKLKALL